MQHLLNNMHVWEKKKRTGETDRIMYGIRLQLATPATLKVNQFIAALEFIAW